MENKELLELYKNRCISRNNSLPSFSRNIKSNSYRSYRSSRQGPDPEMQIAVKDPDTITEK